MGKESEFILSPVAQRYGRKCRHGGGDKRGLSSSLQERASMASAIGGVVSTRLLGASIVSFSLILLSLFTLNYSLIFPAPTAYAANSSSELSISVPTSIQMTIVSTDGDESCDDDINNVLCLRNYDSDEAMVRHGWQSVSVQTNNPTGYTLTVNADTRLVSETDDEISLNYEPDFDKTSSMNSEPNIVRFEWDAYDYSRPSYLVTAGSYLAKVQYIATVNDADGYITSDDKSVTDYLYARKGQKYTARDDGRYKLEVWGSSGYNSSYNDNTKDGIGGYATGEMNLTKGQTLYVYVGGVPEIRTEGGFNGGGSSGTMGAGGGGATHIALADGQLSTLEGQNDKVLIVAGGGGGSDGIPLNQVGNAGNGGGYMGLGSFFNVDGVSLSHANAGTQTAGGIIAPNASDKRNGFFGKGGDSTCNVNSNGTITDCGGAGGGGWYGGSGTDNQTLTAAGGSGYIGSALLSNKHMYGFNVPTSTEPSTYTISGECSNVSAKSDCAKIGNGYARITYLGAN